MNQAVFIWAEWLLSHADSNARVACYFLDKSRVSFTEIRRESAEDFADRFIILEGRYAALMRACLHPAQAVEICDTRCVECRELLEVEPDTGLCESCIHIPYDDPPVVGGPGYAMDQDGAG